jgi:hypothetical protein
VKFWALDFDTRQLEFLGSHPDADAAYVCALERGITVPWVFDQDIALRWRTMIHGGLTYASDIPDVI